MASRPSLDKAAWQRTRAAVRRRDGNACTACGATEGLSVHHIVPARQGGSDELDNLVTLCRLHHGLAERRRPRSATGSEHRLDIDANGIYVDVRDGLYYQAPTERGKRARPLSRRW
jgi:5-methylcytosine-specific restriction endonuclease McrA